MDFKTDGFFHSIFIEMLAERMKPSVYLELGLSKGETFHRVGPHCGKALGVDRDFIGIKEPGYIYYDMTTDEFFK